MKLIFLSIIISICAFSMVACAEKADPAVGGGDGGKKVEDPKGEGEAEAEKLQALKFVGKWKNDTGLPAKPEHQVCDLYLAVDEHGEHEDEEHTDGGHKEEEHAEHGLLMTLDYKTQDDHPAHAGEAQFYLYDNAAKTYHDHDDKVAGAETVLSSVSILEDHEEGEHGHEDGGHEEEEEGELVSGNPMKLADYIKEGILNQSVRIDMNQPVDTEDFTETLEKVLEGEMTLADAKAKLDVVKGVDMILMHGDHPHFPKCEGFKLDSVVEKEFDMGGEHEH